MSAGSSVTVKNSSDSVVSLNQQHAGALAMNTAAVAVFALILSVIARSRKYQRQGDVNLAAAASRARTPSLLAFPSLYFLQPWRRGQHRPPR